jgi:predicted unusual protein kinase regulating ubiquinone biosynthesis (AarF/ABC1/UbiB family)
MPSGRSPREGAAPDAPGARARYRRILRFAALVLVQSWWYELVLPRIGLERVAERTRTARLTVVAQRFHTLALELGGLMIKVGQFLSSRLDVLPPEITRELAGLQDEVPPAGFDAVGRLAADELGVPLTEAFATFDEVPVAAASLGQAHRARLGEHDATDAGFDRVVVKVQRPGIRSIVDVDLAALRRIAGWLSHLRVVSTRVDPRALTAEFAKTSLEEIDYLHEAVAAERFARLFTDDPRVDVPAVPFQLPENFLLVIRSMSLTSGVCSALDPDFNIWDAIEPYASRLLREESGNIVLEVAREALSAAGVFVRLPGRIDTLISRVNDGAVTVSTPALDRRLSRLEQLIRRAVGAILFAGFLVGGILLLPVAVPLGVVLMCVSVVPLLYALVGGGARR